MSIDKAGKKSTIFEPNCIVDFIGRNDARARSSIVADKRMLGLKSMIFINQFRQPGC